MVATPLLSRTFICETRGRTTLSLIDRKSTESSPIVSYTTLKGVTEPRNIGPLRTTTIQAATRRDVRLSRAFFHSCPAEGAHVVTFAAAFRETPQLRPLMWPPPPVCGLVTAT